MQKIRKIQKSALIVILCDLVTRKTINMVYGQQCLQRHGGSDLDMRHLGLAGGG
jgi:hypothetical protein